VKAEEKQRESESFLYENVGRSVIVKVWVDLTKPEQQFIMKVFMRILSQKSSHFEGKRKKRI